MKMIIASGFFNPLTVGHINYLKAAKTMGDYLWVIVNNDEQVKLKGSIPFMDELERCNIIGELKPTYSAVIASDMDLSVSETIGDLAEINEKFFHYECIFANGGDVKEEDVREREVCEKYGIKIVCGVGGSKIQSSSSLLKKVIDKYAKL